MEDLQKTYEYNNQLRRAKIDARRKEKIAEKRKKRAEKWYWINTESAKYSTRIFVDKDQ